MHLNLISYESFTRYNGIECHKETTDKSRMEDSKRTVFKAKETAPTKRNARRHLPLPSRGLRSSRVHHGLWMLKARNTATRLVVLVWLETIWRRKISEKMMPTRSDRNRHCKPRASTSTMPSFDVTSGFGKNFALAYQRLGRFEKCGTGHEDSTESINGRRIYPFNKGLRIYGGVYHPLLTR